MKNVIEPIALPVDSEDIVYSSLPNLYTTCNLARTTQTHGTSTDWYTPPS